MGNPRPVFRFEEAVVAQVRRFGKAQEHLELTVCPYSEYGHLGKKVKAIAFFTAPDAYGMPLTQGARVTVLAHMEVNRFGGSNEVRLRLVEVE